MCVKLDAESIGIMSIGGTIPKVYITEPRLIKKVFLQIISDFIACYFFGFYLYQFVNYRLPN